MRRILLQELSAMVRELGANGIRDDSPLRIWEIKFLVGTG